MRPTNSSAHDHVGGDVWNLCVATVKPLTINANGPNPKSLVGSPLNAVAFGPPELATKRRAAGRPPPLKIPAEQSLRSHALIFPWRYPLVVG